MKKISLIPLVMITIMFAGCTVEKEMPDDGTVWSANFVQVYIEATDFEPRWQPETNAIRIIFNGEELYKGDKFDKYAEKYGDTDFNGRLVPATNRVIANEFTNVLVTSDNDFNEIPAGTPLNGVIKFCSASPLPFIESGYKDWFSWKSNQPEEYKAGNWYQNSGFYPVTKMLSEITTSDILILAQRLIYLLFTETPAEKNHNMTITFKDDKITIVNDLAVVFGQQVIDE